MTIIEMFSPYSDFYPRIIVDNRLSKSQPEKVKILLEAVKKFPQGIWIKKKLQRFKIVYIHLNDADSASRYGKFGGDTLAFVSPKDNNSVRLSRIHIYAEVTHDKFSVSSLVTSLRHELTHILKKTIAPTLVAKERLVRQRLVVANNKWLMNERAIKKKYSADSDEICNWFLLRERIFRLMKNLVNEGVAELIGKNVRWSEKTLYDSQEYAEEIIDTIIDALDYLIRLFKFRYKHKGEEEYIRELDEEWDDWYDSLKSAIADAAYSVGFHMAYVIMRANEDIGFDELIKMSYIKFTRSYVKFCGALGLKPLVSYSSGAGKFSYNKYLKELAKVANLYKIK